MITYNVRGLGESQKRRQIFHHLHKKNFDIMCLQETHSTKSIEKFWSTEWGSKIWFDHGDSRSRGTAILFSPRVNFEVHNVINSGIGPYQVLYGTLRNFKILLVNVYAPNTDDPGFFDRVTSDIDRFSPDFTLLAGDFNLAIDERLDCTGAGGNNVKAARKLNSFVENRSLLDTWRYFRPDENGYTWRRLKPKPTFSRLDYIFASENLVQMIDTINLLPGYKTDHSTLLITLVFNPQVRGPGYWKLNNSLLRDLDYLDKVNCLLEMELEVDYSSARTKWENIKLAIRNSTLQYAINKKKSNDNKVQVLTKKLKSLEEEQIKQTGVVFNDATEQIRLVRHELQQIHKLKTQGAIVRSRSKFTLEGEKAH